jgi:hypothetical protein
MACRKLQNYILLSLRIPLPYLIGLVYGVVSSGEKDIGTNCQIQI